MAADTPREFEIYPTGDPHNRTGWDVSEKDVGGHWFFRGDLSPIQGRDRAKARLRMLYPTATIGVRK